MDYGYGGTLDEMGQCILDDGGAGLLDGEVVFLRDFVLDENHLRLL